MDKMIKVLFLPYLEKNPYQKALANALLKEGVSVDFGIVSRLFSVLTSSRNHWRPEILHLHWQHPFLLGGTKLKTILKSVSFMSELLVLKLVGIKLIWTVHNIVNHEKRFSSLELFFNKFIARLCDRVIVHSSSAKNEVMEAFKIDKSSQIVVIPHGNYIDYYENIISKSEARKKLKLSSENKIFLYFGTIRPYKGIPELIEAFKNLNPLNLILLIVGQPYNSQIAENILKRCEGIKNIRSIFKFILPEEIQIYMNAADVVVLPYQRILTSGAVILAMSFAKPIIAPASGCIPDVLDGKGSILYDPLEKKGLLKAMKQALSVDLKKMGEHNFKLAKKLDWKNIAKRTYKIYQECLNLTK